MQPFLISKCNDILTELNKFSDNILFLGDPIADNRLLGFENKIGFQLPADFKYLLTKHNSFSLAGTEVYGLDKQFKGSSIDEVYTFEHEEVGNPMPKEFLPFSPDGAGNNYCLDLSKRLDDQCPVIFWQHDFFYTDKFDVEVCNSSFIDWITEVMIQWTLEDTNHDGSEKLNEKA